MTKILAILALVTITLFAGLTNIPLHHDLPPLAPAEGDDNAGSH